MEDLFIQNQGFNKTWVSTPLINNKREVDWNMNYNGKHANIDVELKNNDIIQEKYQILLNNNDLYKFEMK